MRGKLIKTEQGWMVEYKVDENTPIGHKSWWEKILLHPDDVRQINEDAKVFDNIEARISAYPDVDFYIWEQSTKYAKLYSRPQID
jgi:hypothetical protein